MKRSQPEPSTSEPPKKQPMTKIFETVNIGPVSNEVRHHAYYISYTLK